jgi:hypothetical protein
MKLSEKTLLILKNYASINQGIVIDVGSQLKTIAVSRTTYSEAEVAEKFEKEFVIYDLNDFLSIYSNFKDPELTFFDNYLEIYSPGIKGKGTYYYGAKSMVEHPETIPKIPDAYFTLNITEDQLVSVLKMANAFQLDELIIYNGGESIVAGAVNSQNPTSNSYHIEIADSNLDLQPFSIYFRKETLKILPDNYSITISQLKKQDENDSGIRVATFQGNDIKYHVAIEEHSTFGN